MAFSRAAAFRSSLRAARPAASRPQLWRQVVRRSYATGGHESAKAGGDAVWAIGAVAVTVPTCWYLLQHAPDNSHGHEDHADSHAKSHHDEEGDEESKNEPEETSEREDKDSEKTEASDSDDESQEGDTPETSDDESKDGENEGGNKGETTESGAKDEPNDKPAPSKPAGSFNTQSGKQEGLSNTDTKHSTDISSSEQSKKGEGSPESAKVKGTVNLK